MNIRKMEQRDRAEVIEMMREFYSSPAVLSNGSQEIFEADFDNCVSDSPYIEGFVCENDGTIQGYAMVAKSFSTEFGKPCMWIEDLYIKKEYRSLGIGNAIMSYIIEKYTDCIFRLEVEEENENAVRLYKKHGFDVLPYVEMKK